MWTRHAFWLVDVGRRGGVTHVSVVTFSIGEGPAEGWMRCRAGGCAARRTGCSVAHSGQCANSRSAKSGEPRTESNEPALRSLLFALRCYFTGRSPRLAGTCQLAKVLSAPGTAHA